MHILKLEERKAPELVPYEEIRDYLREHLSEQKMEAAVSKKIDALVAAADVEVLIPLSASN